MTIESIINTACCALREHSETPLLDCEVLLCDILGKNRAWIRAHSNDLVSSEVSVSFMGMISRRQEGEPIAYIRGSAEFYGRTFTVNESVLVPRPESETMIDLLKELHREDDSAVSYRIADVGSGSGALGLSAYLELPRVALDLYDIDRSTLEVAKNNARIHHVAAHTYCSDLLTDSHGPYDIILANLPYVPLGYPINLAAKYEPSIALFAGKDGLDLYRTLFSQLETFVWKPKELYTESLIESHKDLYEIALSHGYRLIVEKDLIQVFSPS